MIASFADDDARKIFDGQIVPRFANIAKRARNKLQQLDNTVTLYDLREPPGNRLEALIGDRAGQYSIRVNQQYRICFRWLEGSAYAVEIADYH